MAETKPIIKGNITVRQATLYDHIAIGQNSSDTYFDKPLTKFLSPGKEKYYSHYVRGFTQRAIIRMFDPRNLTFVAVDTDTGKVIGHIQSMRAGDDEGARKQIAARKSIWLLLLSWVFWAWCTALDFVVGGDKSGNKEAGKLFEKWGGLDQEKYWNAHPERHARWHVQSCVVRPEYQGRGIGKRLMGEVLRRAQAEDVVVGLEASEEGELMYRKVGFELLGRFDIGTWGDSLGNLGGIMMWKPVGWKGEKAES